MGLWKVIKPAIMAAIAVALCGCGLLGKPWERAKTLADAVRIEGPSSVHCRYYRTSPTEVTVTFVNQYGDHMIYWLSWPVAWGVVISPCNIRTESGDDPVVVRSKYRGSF